MVGCHSLRGCHTRWTLAISVAILSQSPVVNATEPVKGSLWGDGTLPMVRASAQTVSVGKDGDAADDPAIWVNSADPAKSLIIGTDKQAGLNVYALDGRLMQSLPHGRMNNVDVAHGIRAQGATETVDLVFASNRSGDSLAAYAVDRSTGMLSILPGAPFKTDLNEVYGLCAWTDLTDGTARVLVNSKGGQVRIFAVMPPPAGADGSIDPAALWTALVLRSFDVGTQTEGCSADVTLGAVYIGEETVGVWRYPLGPLAEDEPARALMDVVSRDMAGTRVGHLARDVEGICIYQQGPAEGWIIVSCQSEDRYAVYERQSNAYVGSFRIGMPRPDGTLEPVTHTDGLTVTSRPLGPAYPRGVLVVQDDNESVNQNFKVIDWRAVEAALNLKSPAQSPSLMGK